MRREGRQGSRGGDGGREGGEKAGVQVHQKKAKQSRGGQQKE